MSKTAKMIFALVNVIYFGFTFLAVPYLPNPLLFGWLPGQLAAYLVGLLFASAFWGLYFNKFFDSQDENRYK